MHKPISLQNLCLSFPSKNCFEDFNQQILFGQRIAIIGRNGSGKSTLLKILYGQVQATSGDVYLPEEVVCGHVPQTIDDDVLFSGGQRFNKALTKALSLNPNVLLLDEPTNHLDQKNRNSLMRMLKGYYGTLILVSHDTQLLKNCVDVFWRIEDNKVHVFSGCYDDCLVEIKIKRKSIEKQLSRLRTEKKNAHQTLMKEQKRAASSKASGRKNIDQRKWPTVVSKAKAIRSEQTSGKRRSAISERKQELTEQLSELRLPEIIVPKFSLSSNDLGSGALVSIRHAQVGYQEDKLFLRDVNLLVSAKEQVVISGENGAGKSTLIKAILKDGKIIKTGHWTLPKPQDIGYLDQHYANLGLKKTVIQSIETIVPTWSHAEIRKHLNDFLFRKNEEVNMLIENLSGGEKVRLSLALMAAVTPRLLILDEITNNLDMETKRHVTQVLCCYPGAIILISHDEDFLSELTVEKRYQIKDGKLWLT